MFRYLIPLTCVLFFTACANWSTAQSAPMFSIASPADAGTITYTFQDERVWFEILSERGIGSARITQTAGAAPNQITLRLYLKGLEHFKFSFDNQSVEIEIPTSGDHTPRESVEPDSPLYMPVKIVSQDNAYPIQNGYIEIELPRAYYESRAREFSIEWIDFYR